MTPSPLAVGVASLICLVFGLLYMALQVRAIFSDQIEQEYVALVLESVTRADAAQNAALAWQRMPQSAANAAAYQSAIAALRDRIAEVDALAGHSPVPAPRFTGDVAVTGAGPDAIRAALAATGQHWRSRHDELSNDMRHRTLRIACALAVLTIVVVGALLNALAVYVRRHQRLAGMTNQLAHAAQHDGMTGLPNRQKLLSALEATVASAPAVEPPATIALIYLDLDGFKHVNDTFGHGVGDQFLILVAKRFRQSLRPDDIVARLGGDEFAVLVKGAGDVELTTIAMRLLACVKEIDGQMGLGIVSASIGIAAYPDPFFDHRLLIAAADKAMYDVKRNGKNGYAFAVPVT
ncbi:diguanylate cyclase domain-containing protein [Paraburkholderia sp. GAS448]|uniref:diguanylate cyclase domain-containing protein n=1 Tax=Paraburkholderia sp. GAS448 TaxID=3035136 RepID=UPI003D242925